MADTAYITLFNCSKQLIPLQVRPPGSDFYTNEQQIHLSPGKHVRLKKSHVMMDQLQNLQRRRCIRILHNEPSE